MQGVKKEGNSNNSNAPGDISDPLKGGMEVVQGPCLEFLFCTLEGGHKREKGQKLCLITEADDPFLPKSPWSHFKSYSPTRT